MSKLISIVIPTLNRAKYIGYTLYAYKDQINRNSDKVELIVCDNASTDETISVLENIYAECPFFIIRKFLDTVIIGESIARAIGQANAKYVLMWGDDDLPAPFMIDSLIHYIYKYPESKLFHLNRLFGYDAIESIQNLTVQKPYYTSEVIVYHNLNDFINQYFLDTTFLSSMMFQKNSWINSTDIDCKRHYGYEFLFSIYCGVKDQTCVYINYPMCIQRQPLNRVWLNKSPLYRFIGMPNLLFDMQKAGLINNAKKLWMRTGNTSTSFLRVAIQITLYKKEYQSLCEEINYYQYSIIRKISIYMFAYIFPAIIYKIIRHLYFFVKQR